MSDFKPVACVRLNAGNDRNGNPRRLDVILDNRGDWRVAKEGYRGAVKIGGVECNLFPEFPTTPNGYRRAVREARDIHRFIEWD